MTAEARYVIGLDIGDGESCLGWAPLDRSAPVRIFARPRSGERSIVTAMARSPAGSADPAVRLFGDEAVTSHGVTHFSVNFKEAPAVFATEPPAAVVFARALLTEFREQHPEVVRDGMAYVGHPAGWSTETVAAYGRHLELLDLPVRLVPESQSALLHVRDRRRDERRLDRVLVVDIGSSTTDFTIVEDLVPRNLPVGATLGCRQIDERLAGLVRTALCDDAALTAALAGDGGPDFLLLACRWAKEAQFTGMVRRIMDLRESCHERFRPIVATAWTWLLDLEIAQLVTAPGGWGEDFRAVLTEAADMLGDRLPDLVVLTGGGSRMPFIDRWCRAVFPAAEIEHDDDPAFTVARGLVSNGQHRAAVTRFRRDVDDLVRGPEVAEVVRTEAVAALETMKRKITDQVAESRGSAATLANHIKFGMFETKCALADAIAYHLSMRVERICRRHGVPAGRVRLDLTLPDLFTDRLDHILACVGGAQRFTEHSLPVTIGIDVVREAAESRLRAEMEERWGRYVPGLAASVAGAVSSAGSGLVTERAAELWIRRLLKVGRYSPDELERITADVLTAIADQTGAAARELERWLA
ncbi:Hsp70 family protein [Actinoplanes sp. G11-F43]|uniref:Hsp70 family protein n=1 Tax=Actinoplanes sp. G11-F43 TaxID=3424130 RepID=UPI003D3370CF